MNERVPVGTVQDLRNDLIEIILQILAPQLDVQANVNVTQHHLLQEAITGYEADLNRLGLDGLES